MATEQLSAGSGAATTRWSAGVISYKAMGYWRPDYVPKDTDILAAFRITPQPGVDPEEAGAAVAGESSTATWTVVWTDRLTDRERYQAKCYRVDQVPGRSISTSPTSPTTSTCSKRARSPTSRRRSSATCSGSRRSGASARGHAHPGRLCEDVRRPAAWDRRRARDARQVRAAAHRLHRQAQARSLLAATTAGWSMRACKGGLDFTKDDENINSQPFMRWRERFLYCMEAVERAQERTGEIKGHYLNVTAASMEDMYERADFAKELGSNVIMMDLTIGYTAMTSMSKWARRNGVLLHLHRAGHGTYTRQKTHGVSFRVIAKWCRMLGVDHLHAGTVVGKLEGDPDLVAGYYDTLRDNVIPANPAHGIYFDQEWASMPGVMPVASGGIHAGQTHQLLHYLGEDCILQFGGGTIGHPMGIAAGAAANRVARRGGHQGAERGPRCARPRRGDPAQSRRAVPRAARRARHLGPRDVRLRLDRHARRRGHAVVTTGRDMLTQGTFSHLPDLDDGEIEAQVLYAITNGWAISIELTDDPQPRSMYWELWGLPMFDLSDPRAAMVEIDGCRRAFPNHYVRVNAFDNRRSRETIALSFIVQRPPAEPGFQLVRQHAPGRTNRYTLQPYAATQPHGERYR